MNEAIGKMLIVLGLIAIAAGILFLAIGKLGGVPRLPGDIYIQKDGFTFYFPIVTCIVISLVLTLIMSLGGRR